MATVYPSWKVSTEGSMLAFETSRRVAQEQIETRVHASCDQLCRILGGLNKAHHVRERKQQGRKKQRENRVAEREGDGTSRQGERRRKMGRRLQKEDSEMKLEGREGRSPCAFSSLSCSMAFGEVFSVLYLCCHGNSLDSRENLEKTRSRWIAQREGEEKRAA
ncbi:hypothetical protein DBV15_09908 [Temnothorax longispinosus]|uniref:Uncharacterized protein n=1 Tax=Temnothorax longispinosus TaxID=300112 RepID=A0A4S2KEX4_9HYME|nr:hypothetical protein DBV15_09908 [Temnothorax longispinosus]